MTGYHTAAPHSHPDLSAYNLESRTDRLVLADLLAEHGRDGEAALCRALPRPVYLHGGAVISPRNLYYREGDFSNRYDIFVVPAHMRGRFESAFPDAERVSRARAVRLGWSRPREAGRTGEQWFGGFRQAMQPWDADPSTPAEAIAEARRATVEAVEEAEHMAAVGEEGWY